ncbi:hypothetical protein JDV02_006740 [Purpureocillium takamizusanense]|uniref:Secreted protein n=1 Tax=Purpureocillium takamizusanense TaxID=2060973 RepID=A0A9Q8VDC0_9HYPO|nr:uncharacterized protein JDV02_006740 [Purpureocillium takamizusanense]UNI20672.1 hypothetical protein JDV02_006740 [Purpureocillium takamizusanense]
MHAKLLFCAAYMLTRAASSAPGGSSIPWCLDNRVKYHDLSNEDYANRMANEYNCHNPVLGRCNPDTQLCVYEEARPDNVQPLSDNGWTVAYSQKSVKCYEACPHEITHHNCRLSPAGMGETYVRCGLNAEDALTPV